MSLFDDQPAWGTPVEVERRNRIKLSVAAYAYEFLSTSIMSDDQFDKLAKQIDVSVDTGNAKLDKYFQKYFNPDTGQWIHKHPELDKIAQCYKKAVAKKTGP